MLEKYLVQTCKILNNVKRDEFASYIDDNTGVNESCRFRYINTIRRENHAEVSDSDAMLWLKYGTVAINGSIVLFEGVYYQIERLNRARKLGRSNVEFVKCDLKVIRVIVS